MSTYGRGDAGSRPVGSVARSRHRLSPQPSTTCRNSWAQTPGQACTDKVSMTHNPIALAVNVSGEGAHQQDPEGDNHGTTERQQGSTGMQSGCRWVSGSQGIKSQAFSSLGRKKQPAWLRGYGVCRLPWEGCLRVSHTRPWSSPSQHPRACQGPLILLGETPAIISPYSRLWQLRGDRGFPGS